MAKSASADGEIALVRFAPGEDPARDPLFVRYRLKAFEVVDAIDLALLWSPDLRSCPHVLPISFEPLRLLDAATAIGFPVAIDPQHLLLVHLGG